ncbi:hypothetical protein QI297_03150 [Staphylococcus saprophyticus]|nr:hypothetical protein [Staphylococcus saprophyticus]
MLDIFNSLALGGVDFGRVFGLTIAANFSVRSSLIVVAFLF